MSTSPGAPETSSGSALLGHPLDSYHIAQGLISPKGPRRTSVEDPEHLGKRKAQRRGDASALNRAKSYSSSSRTTTASSTHANHHHEHGEVRTLPPWIDSFEQSNNELVPSRARDMQVSAPRPAHSAKHHYSPTKLERRISQDGFVESDDEISQDTLTKVLERGFFGGSKEPDKGRKWDHARQGDPVILQSGIPQTSSRWTSFVKSSMYGPARGEDRRRVDTSFLDAQTPGYGKPWRGDLEGEDLEKALGLRPSKKRRRIWYQRIQHSLLVHPLVPLAFRLIVLTTSTLALALSSSIYYLTQYSSFHQIASTTMAIIVDVVAMPYIGYITWDEYTGKPLGLRSPKAKIRLVLLDLFFIIFESANLALAFEAILDESGTCRPGDNGSDESICRRMETLAAFLFIALLAWILTFSVSIFRLVERVGGRDEND